jgi:hypothetical protein
MSVRDHYEGCFRHAKTKDRVTRTPLISLFHCHNTMSVRDNYEGYSIVAMKQ